MRSTIALILLSTFAFSNSFAYENLNYDIHANINPAEHFLNAQVTIDTTRFHKNPIQFELHKNLSLTVSSGQLSVVRENELTRTYALLLVKNTPQLQMNYSGQIYHPIQNDETPGLISAEGVSLSSAVAWYPLFTDELYSFSLHVTLPRGWKAVSQGMRLSASEDDFYSTTLWQETHPQDDIYLIAAPFIEYTRILNGIELNVFLRTADPSLANRFLDAGEKFLTLYSQSIAPYPYTKFATIENFWETGYGMPSFTLLGPTVIRLPFILYSSYPHEILHNWWGNSVYVDYETGNWCEGLTTYQADHFLQVQRGTDQLYRRTTLKSYTDYVKAGFDFPLKEFKGRNSEASQAIGYGKSLMVFHMLKTQLGSDLFDAGLRDFYRTKKFQRASYTDLQHSFSNVSGIDLTTFFSQWIERKGAPELSLKKPLLKQIALNYELSFTLAQEQSEPPFSLSIPIQFEYIDGTRETHYINMSQQEQSWNFTLTKKLQRLSIDSNFDVFRKLSPFEVPPTLSSILGESERIVVILPSSSSLSTSWQNWVTELQTHYPFTIETIDDNNFNSQVATQIKQASVWILGWENKALPWFIDETNKLPITIQSDEIKLPSGTLQRNHHSGLIVVRKNDGGGKYLALFVSQFEALIPRLNTKMWHYGSSSYLGFDSETNILKGEWPVQDSPLNATFL